jgi:capsular exopolysaccharide synthesis family protein
MRRPNIHKYFPQAASSLSSYLSGEVLWTEMVYRTGTRGLDVLLCGPLPTNPAELLSSESMRKLIREATATYNFVVLDSPSLLNVADSRILASMVDATVLVVKGGDTPRQVVQYAESQARSAGANLLGVVVNNLDIRFTDFPYYACNPLEDCVSNPI